MRRDAVESEFHPHVGKARREAHLIAGPRMPVEEGITAVEAVFDWRAYLEENFKTEYRPRINDL